jgi:mannosyltransferase OCH1-like enzyme
MIPKVIHYCWFGRNPLPKSALRCIASWRKYLPDYEIKEWNEDNFDLDAIAYTHEAYQAKKYAFVSDYVRFWVLYHHGGIYFDTDVEVVKPMDHILNRGAFMGIEKSAVMDGKPMVNPGLGMGAEAGHPFFLSMLQKYHQLHYLNPDGTVAETVTIVTHTTRRLYELGMKPIKELQEVNNIWIYPEEYFCPMDSTTGITRVVKETVSIHHYDCSWMDMGTWSFKMHLIKNRIYRLLGEKAALYINSKLHR